MVQIDLEKGERRGGRIVKRGCFFTHIEYLTARRYCNQKKIK